MGFFYGIVVYIVDIHQLVQPRNNKLHVCHSPCTISVSVGCTAQMGVVTEDTKVGSLAALIVLAWVHEGGF